MDHPLSAGGRTRRQSSLDESERQEERGPSGGDGDPGL